MSGDPRCIICRGDGVIRDAAGRDERCACVDAPRRDPHAPSFEGWLGAAMPDVLSRMRTWQAAAEAHAASCTERPCERCERFVCGCGKPLDGIKQCAECYSAEVGRDAMTALSERLPKRFRWAVDADHATIQKRVQGSPALIARALAAPPSADMMLFGDTGVGKTSLVVAMLASWVRQSPRDREEAVFAEAYWLAGARARFPLGQGEAPEVREARRAPLLVLDDLGSESEDGRGVIRDVIFKRHNEELPTWITTGFTSEQLVNRYGSQILRRVTEPGKQVLLGKRAA